MWEGKYRQMKIHNVKSKWNKKGGFMKAIKNRWGGLFVFLLVLSTVVFFGCPSEAPQPAPGLELDGEFITYYNQNTEYNIKFDSENQKFTFKYQYYDSNFKIIYKEKTVNYRYVDDKIQTYAANVLSAGSRNGNRENIDFTYQFEIKINPEDNDAIIVTEKLTYEDTPINTYETIFVKKDVEKSYIDGTWENGAETLYVDSELYGLDYSALIEKNGSISRHGEFQPLEGHKNYFWCEIERAGVTVYEGFAIVSKNNIYINDNVTENIVVFSKKSDSVKVFPESQNKYIGEYKTINNDTLTIENSKISLNLDNTIFWWDDGLRCKPKAVELKYSYDIFTDERDCILGSQNLEFDILDGNNEFIETEESLTTFSLKKESDMMMSFYELFEISEKRRLTQYFVKVNNDADVDFVGTWTTESTADGLESVSFTVNEDNTYSLVTNGEEEIGTFDVESANEENYFSYDDYFKGLIAADGSLYLKFLYTHNTKGEPYYAQLFFTKQ